MTEVEMCNSTGYLLAQVCKSHRNKAGELLAEVDLYVGQEMFLAELWQEDGLSQSEIVDNLLVKPATVTRMLDRMEKSGLVERRKDLEDQRVSRVFLTEKGHSLHNEVEVVWQRLEDISLANFSLEERVLFRRLLLQLVENLSS
jgi:DNA-binding MarR family transcriptional regulator